MDDTDEYCLKKLKHKSYKAFECVFNRYYAVLCRFAYGYLMNRELAKDVVSETFCALWESSFSLSEEVPLSKYLYASVKHACLDHLKHLQVVDLNQERLMEALIYSGMTEYEDNSELIGKLRRCLDLLPGQRRRVLELKVFNGMGYREIANVLNISETTVHTHIKRAYKFIRETLPAYC